MTLVQWLLVTGAHCDRDAKGLCPYYPTLFKDRILSKEQTWLVKMLRYTQDSRTRIPFKELFIERSLHKPQLSMTVFFS